MTAEFQLLDLEALQCLLSV